jgi:hypothetical protein
MARAPRRTGRRCHALDRRGHPAPPNGAACAARMNAARSSSASPVNSVAAAEHYRARRPDSRRAAFRRHRAVAS